MGGIQIGKFRLGGFRLKSLAINAVLLLLGVGNAVAAVAEWYDSAGMLVYNGVCVALLVLAVMHKVLTMEPRKKWRILSFIVPAMGVISLLCARVVDSTNEYPNLIMPLIILGAVLLVVGVVCIVRWRRYSLARKAELQESSQKGGKR